MNISGFRLIAGFVFCLALTTAYSHTTNEPSDLDAMSDRIKAGIESVVHIVSPRLDASVESYLRTYTERSRTKTENMIGRSPLYFPMFEQELLASGLPIDLKYLAVVESALTPHAISRVGATGLWQFMRPTAREYGLQITKYVDERCDPLSSTKAAINYLRSLYKQFDSWELAMAAYNAGPGRVRYAIRKSGTKDYWKLQGHLPKETRAYVPGFIAASYIMNYYEDHGLVPAFLSTDLTETATIQVFKDLDFMKIQQITGIDAEVISYLNPKYIRKFIPASDAGYELVLPAHATTTMLAYLNADGDVAVTDHSEFAMIETGVEMEYVEKLMEHTYTVKSGDNLYTLAKKHDCTVTDLQKWNKLSGSMLHVGQRLKIHKLERVLVKTIRPALATPAPARSTVHLPVLSNVLKSQIGITSTTSTIHAEPVPVLKPAPDLSGSRSVLRRRMSVRDMGKRTELPHTTLLPGQRLE